MLENQHAAWFIQVPNVWKGWVAKTASIFAPNWDTHNKKNWARRYIYFKYWVTITKSNDWVTKEQRLNKNSIHKLSA